MQYQVPQFIDVEDKIIGPLTLRQFFIIASGCGFTFFLSFVLTPAYAIAIGLPVVICSLALAFVKKDGMPLWRYLIAMASFARRPQQYYWQKKP
jgi:hypothetical protein